MADDTNAQKIKQFNQKNAAGRMQGTPANPTQTVTPVVTPNARMSVSDIELLLKDQTTLSKEELLRRQALSTKENLRIAEEEKKKQERETRERNIAERNVRRLVTDEALSASDRAMNNLSPMLNWVGKRPTPGGIATLLVIIAVFLMAIMPAGPNGETRLKLLWLTLSGKTQINYTATGNNSSSSDNSQQSYSNVTPLYPTDTTQPTQNTTATPNYDPSLNPAIGQLWNL